MISVIVPAYNAERFIENALNSVLRQTCSDFEIIVVNDGSQDSTDRICRKMAASDQRIRYFGKKNTGVSDTRNFAFSKMTGEYVFFLDADDFLPEKAFELLMAEMEKGDCDAVYGNHAYSYGADPLPRVPRIASGVYHWDELKNIFLDDGTLTGILFGSDCGVLYKSSVIQEHHLRFCCEMKVNEDGLFNLEFLMAASQIRVMEEPYVYVYNQWKSHADRPLERDYRFDSSERIIEACLEGKGLKEEFADQLSCRKVSVAFWNAVRVKDAKTDLKQACLYLQELFGDPEVKEGLRCLDYSRMSKYKRVFCFLMRRRMYAAFYLLLRYIYPMAEKVIKR
ncbi:MAG: glycosyltransferase [Lachnospiraceae bacterium]|nr:glycosyltransferase [Lachnospiraceae bacterium]